MRRSIALIVELRRIEVTSPGWIVWKVRVCPRSADGRSFSFMFIRLIPRSLNDRKHRFRLALTTVIDSNTELKLDNDLTYRFHRMSQFRRTWHVQIRTPAVSRVASFPSTTISSWCKRAIWYRIRNLQLLTFEIKNDFFFFSCKSNNIFS